MSSPWGSVRLTTIVAVALVLAAVAWRTRSLRTAVVTVIASLWAYEVVWNVTDVWVHRLGWVPLLPWWLMLACGWVGWMWREGWLPSFRILTVFAVAHLAWVATGFHYNDKVAGSPWSWADEAWNVSTKTIWLAAWAIGTFRSEPFVRGGLPNLRRTVLGILGRWREVRPTPASGRQGPG